MTKESKLALILSFVLILVVGVLISDHFSHASSMRDGIDAPDAGHAVESIDPVRPLPESAAYRGERAERAGSVLERLSEIQMLDVKIPATDGREVRMRRYTKPEKVHQLLLDRLGLTLPGQPPPEIRQPSGVVETF